MNTVINFHLVLFIDGLVSTGSAKSGALFFNSNETLTLNGLSQFLINIATDSIHHPIK
ncbi:MAG: hypothetical protein RLZZ28_1886 [Bacteroidota bacterium]|jgi:hypothetical protein